MSTETERSAPDARKSAEQPPTGPVLVVGGAGYIGSHTVRLLEERGVAALALDDLSTGHREAVRAPLLHVSLGDRDALRNAFSEHRPRSVVHFAAKCYVGESMENPAKYYRENVVYTWNLLEAMREASCPEIVFSSSCSTYGPPVEIPMGDDHPQAPISVYGRTKLHMEHMIGDYARSYGLRYAALRYFNAAGAAPELGLGEDHDPETHLIPVVLQVALGKRDEIVINGDDYETKDGTCIRDYVHVMDLADAHLRALAILQSGGPNLACNLGSGRGYSIREILEVARRVTGHPIPETVGPRRPGDPPELVSGGVRAGEWLGWKPARSELERIVADTWSFLEKKPQGFAG